MVDSKNKGAGSSVSKDANIHEGEINLMDYFRVLWIRKWFVLLATVLPTLTVGLFLYLSPRSYKVTYIYDVGGDIKNGIRDDIKNDVSNWNLNKKNYDVLLSRFYSEENLNGIINKFRENGLNKYAESVNVSRNNLDDLKNLLKFEPIPSYVDFPKLKVTDSKQLEQLWDITAQLLNMTIIGKSKEDLPKIACVIRENFESVIPVYMIYKQLSTDIRTYKNRMANIESNKFSIELSLKTNKFVLEKIKSMKGQIIGKTERDIVLQLGSTNDITKYLPLVYQRQAVGLDIVELEKQVRINEGNYNYCKDLLALSKKLSAELKPNISSCYPIQQFHSFLTELIGYYKAVELNDYLASYIKRIENRISVSYPISENPEIFPIAKGTVKKSAIVFVIALMMSIFISLLLEKTGCDFVETHLEKREHIKNV